MKKAFIAITIVIVVIGCGCKKDACFSPSRNLENAYLSGSEGCPCNELNDRDTCVEDNDGKKVALVCENGFWVAVEDGPCMKLPGE
jgi:hypothetical protein